jgi:hypothetical protein
MVLAMLPHSHFIAGFLFGILGWKLGFIQPTDIIIIAVLAVLIDIDHYIHYIFKHKDFNIKKTWNNSSANKEYQRTFIHQLSGIAIIVPLIFVLMWFSPRLGYIALAAYMPHMLLDYLCMIDKHLVEYKYVNIKGFMVPWNFGQESIFLMLSVISLVFLSFSI